MQNIMSDRRILPYQSRPNVTDIGFQRQGSADPQLSSSMGIASQSVKLGTSFIEQPDDLSSA